MERRASREELQHVRGSLWEKVVTGTARHSFSADGFDLNLLKDEEEDQSESTSREQLEAPRGRSSSFFRRELRGLLDEELLSSGGNKRLLVPVLLGTFILISANDPIIKAASKAEVEKGQSRVFLYSVSSVVFVASSLSVLLGNALAFWSDGLQGLKRCWDVKVILQMALPSSMFTGCVLLKFVTLSYMPADMVMLLDQSSLVLMAVLMRYMFKKSYSSSQWISLLLISLSMLQYMSLRDGNKRGEEVSTPAEMSGQLLFGLSLMTVQVIISALAALLAEKLLKQMKTRFWEQKACMEVSGALVSWCSCYVLMPRCLGDRSVLDKGLFHGWDAMTVLVLVMMMCKLWLSGIISKMLDSIVKQLGSCAALLLVYLEMLVLPPPIGSRSMNDFDYNVFVAIIVVASSIASFVISSQHARALAEANAKVDRVRVWAAEGQSVEMT